LNYRPFQIINDQNKQYSQTQVKKESCNVPGPGLLPRLHKANKHKYGSVHIKTVRGRKGNNMDHSTRISNKVHPEHLFYTYSKKLIHNQFILSKIVHSPQTSLHSPPAALSCLD